MDANLENSSRAHFQSTKNSKKSKSSTRLHILICLDNGRTKQFSVRKSYLWAGLAAVGLLLLSQTFTIYRWQQDTKQKIFYENQANTLATTLFRIKIKEGDILENAYPNFEKLYKNKYLTKGQPLGTSKDGGNFPVSPEGLEWHPSNHFSLESPRFKRTSGGISLSFKLRNEGKSPIEGILWSEAEFIGSNGIKTVATHPASLSFFIRDKAYIKANISPLKVRNFKSISYDFAVPSSSTSNPKDSSKNSSQKISNGQFSSVIVKLMKPDGSIEGRRLKIPPQIGTIMPAFVRPAKLSPQPQKTSKKPNAG